MKSNLFKWLYVLAGCVGIGCLPEFTALWAAMEAPTIIISQTDFNFGEQSETTLVSHVFIVKNGGKSTLNIRDVQPSCGCTIARFDRAISPGAEGQITLVVNPKGFQGHVKKTATVLSDDPANPRLVLALEGTIKPLIEVRPEKTVYFQGMANELAGKTIDLITTSKPFHIRKMADDLDNKVGYRLETVEDGKHYRLTVHNNILRGNYRGSITLYTDFDEKPELTIWVNAFIEGEIAIRPKVLVVGQLSPDQGVISGKILVIDNKKKAFKIVRCTYDKRFINVTQTTMPNEAGFSLEVKPEMQNIPPGSRMQSLLTVETDAAPEEKLEVQIQAINLGASPR
jgi:hypothetical protein